MRAIPTSLLFLSLLAGATAASADDFPPITDEERQLTEVPGQPGAPAIVLYEKAELKFMEYPREVSSYLKVHARLKILTEEGVEQGAVEIPHSGFYRLKDVEGRTVLPDGREVALPKDAIFEERRSRSLKRFVTKLVFPAVEVGAILDYRYTIRWDHIFYLQPWYFNSTVPTRRSEITYLKPSNLALQPWGISPPNQQFQIDQQRTTQGLQLTVALEQLPGIPDEPYSFSFNDLSSRFMLIPTEINAPGERIKLLDSWESTCNLYAVEIYKDVRRDDGTAKKRAAQMTAGEKNLLDKVAALHAYVRDQVATVAHLGVGVLEDERVDRVLKELRGTPVAKALLLQAMLEGVKVDSDLVWVADKFAGRIDVDVANPWWFDAALVRVVIDGEPIYLDPVDRSVGFGHLAPYYEGTSGVLVHRKKPEVVELPASPFESNLRRGTVELEVGEEGGVSGEGTLELEGHQAWRYLRWKDDDEATVEAWQEWLEESYPGYDVAGVEVDEDVREQRVQVDWTLALREEEILGDEVSLDPARPIGPATQLFDLPPEQRKTPVQMAYGKRDELTVTVRWPEGWVVDVLPESASLVGAAGEVAWRTEVDDEDRRFTLHRRFDRSRAEFTGGDDYAALRNLYQKAVEADAQSLVLVAE